MRFTPNFGPESVVPATQMTTLQDPQGFFIFWGTYWNTTAGKQYEATLINAAKEVINSPFLQGEMQYGGDGARPPLPAASW